MFRSWRFRHSPEGKMIHVKHRGLTTASLLSCSWLGKLASYLQDLTRIVKLVPLSMIHLLTFCLPIHLIYITLPYPKLFPLLPKLVLRTYSIKHSIHSHHLISGGPALCSIETMHFVLIRDYLKISHHKNDEANWSWYFGQRFLLLKKLLELRTNEVCRGETLARKHSWNIFFRDAWKGRGDKLVQKPVQK